MKKNVYITGYLPLFSIILFSSAFAIHIERLLISKLKFFGVYQGMRELFSAQTIHLSAGFCLFLLFFMTFAALKLLSDSCMQLGLFFFSMDKEGDTLRLTRQGGWIFFGGAMAAVVLNFSLTIILILFAASALVYFFYFLLKASTYMNSVNIMGMVFLQLFFWAAFGLVTAYTVVRLYNALMAGIAS
ncbi:DUF5366 family protein [Fictibacillus iocasae]|uniref:DUF5366 family protein n=1 Tax=Fictibacillus iocasae TaxID=2715437 RepID=A0ABW2NWG8_9BACL